MKKLNKLFENAIKNNEQELQEILEEIEQVSGKMSLEEKFHFIELYEEDFRNRNPKDKEKKEVIKRGKYRVEIRTSTGTKIRTASSQKGLLDVIHGAKNFRVIDDGSNKDITNQIKKFIEARNKQSKSYNKKKPLPESYDVREFTLRIEKSKILNEFRGANIAKALYGAADDLISGAGSYLGRGGVDPQMATLTKTLPSNVGTMALTTPAAQRVVTKAIPTSPQQSYIYKEVPTSKTPTAAATSQAADYSDEGSMLRNPLLQTIAAALGLGVGAATLPYTSSTGEKTTTQTEPAPPSEDIDSYEEDLVNGANIIRQIMNSKGSQNFGLDTVETSPIRDTITINQM
jgi:hypothetical protein